MGQYASCLGGGAVPSVQPTNVAITNPSKHKNCDVYDKSKKTRTRSNPKQVYVVSNIEDTNVASNPINVTSQTAPNQSPLSSYNWSKESTSRSLEPSCPHHVRSAQSQRSSSDFTHDSNLAQQILATLSERNNSVVLGPFTRPSSPHDTPILSSIELFEKDSIINEGHVLPSPKGTRDSFKVPKDLDSEVLESKISEFSCETPEEDCIYEEFDDQVLEIAPEYYFARYGQEGLGTSWYTMHTLLTPPPQIQIIASGSPNATKRLVRKSKLNDLYCQGSLQQSLTLQRQLHQCWMAKQICRSLFHSETSNVEEDQNSNSRTVLHFLRSQNDLC